MNPISLCANWISNSASRKRTSMLIRVVDLRPEDETTIRVVAALLVAGFATHWPQAWPTQEAALQEVRESLGKGRISRVALGERGKALGWIGGISQYRGRVWELHPLVV